MYYFNSFEAALQKQGWMDLPILASPSTTLCSTISAAPSPSHPPSVRTSPLNTSSSQIRPLPQQDGSSLDLNATGGETYAFFIEQVRSCAATIQACAEHQKRMTDDVLQLSRLRSHKLAVLNTYYRPWDMVQTTSRVFGVQAGKKVSSSPSIYFCLYIYIYIYIYFFILPIPATY